MFKPSLKRSKLETFNQISTYSTATPRTASIVKSLPVKRSVESIDSGLAGWSFERKLEQKVREKSQYIFNPLNFKWQEYPQVIEQSLQESQWKSANRGMGMYKDILWHFTQSTMIIVNTANKMESRFKIPEGCNIAAIGQIQNSSLHFHTNGLYIVAIGISNNLLLFGIHKATLKKSQFKSNFTIANSRYVQKIKFIKKSEILIASDTAKLYHFDFSSELKISHQKSSILKAIMPNMSLLYPNNETIQNIQLSESKIYVAISEEKEVSMFAKARHMISTWVASKKAFKATYQRKRIEVYSLDRSKRSIQLVYKLQEKEIIEKLKSKYMELSQMLKEDQEALKIVNISKSTYNNLQALSVVLKCGYFVTISNEKEFIIHDILVAKKENSLGNVGFSLRKTQPKQEERSKMNTVKWSLGLKNLSVMNDGIWYIDNNVVQVVKYQGNLCEIEEVENGEYPRRWVILNQKGGYFIVTRLTNCQIFLGHLLYRNKIFSNQAQFSYNHHQHFQMFMDNFSRVLGLDKICQMLMECLMQEATTLTINDTLFDMIAECLKGCQNKNYRDWHYELSKIVQEPIQIKKEVREELWQFLLNYQYKKIKVYGTNGTDVTNAYCAAIKNIHHKVTAPLLSIRPTNIKSNRNLIQHYFNIFSKIHQFISNKKQHQSAKHHPSPNNQSNYRHQSSSTFKNSYRKDYNYQNNKSLQEQSTEMTLDTSMSMMESNKHNMESIIQIEEMLLASLTKIKSLIFMFMHLADLSENENLPDLMSAIKSRRERLKIKAYLIERVSSREQLAIFAQSFPDLELDKFIRYKEWQESQNKIKNLDLLSLKELAILINSHQIDEIKKIFEGREDILINLMGYYMDYLKIQLNRVQAKRRVYNQKKSSRNNGDLEQQNEILLYLEEEESILQEQMKTIQNQIKLSTSASIVKFITPHQEQPTSIFHEIIRVAASHNHQPILIHLQAELRNNGLIEEIMMLSKMKRKGEKKDSFYQYFEGKEIGRGNNNRRQNIPEERLSNLQNILYNFGQNSGA